MSATEIANAYIALYAKMPGVKGDIEKSLGGSEVSAATENAGKGIGSTLTSAVGGVAKAGLIAVGAVAAAGLGAALVKGFQRLDAIDNAQAKMRGLGHDTQAVDAIMTNALASVKGTAFGLGDAATVAAQVVAAGIAPGEQLEGVLKSVANAAAAAGTDMGDMGSIYAKVASLGKAQNDVLQQVADRGIPIYQALATQLGVSTDEVFKLASAGKIGFAEFETAMTSAAGTVAAEMGMTLGGSWDNFMASLGRIGAGFLGGIFPQIAPLLQAITNALGPLEVIAGNVGAKIGEFLAPAIQWLTDLLNGGFDISGFLELAASLSPIGLLFQALAPVLPTIAAALGEVGAALGGALQSAAQSLAPVLSQLAVAGHEVVDVSWG